MANVIDPYQVACSQVQRVGEMLELDQGTIDILTKPKRELTVNFPVRMDDGSIKMFTGYRVQHNFSRGPCKGGIRYPSPRHSQRGARPVHVDDLEVRHGGASLRR